MGLVGNHKSCKVFMRPRNNCYVAAVNGGPHPKKIRPRKQSILYVLVQCCHGHCSIWLEFNSFRIDYSINETICKEIYCQYE